MAVVTVMAANMRLEIRERGALFATLTELTFGHLWNPCGDREGSFTFIYLMVSSQKLCGFFNACINMDKCCPRVSQWLYLVVD